MNFKIYNRCLIKILMKAIKCQKLQLKFLAIVKHMWYKNKLIITIINNEFLFIKNTSIKTLL